MEFNFVEEKEQVKELDVELTMVDEIPKARSITDPDVRKKARKSRKKAHKKRAGKTEFCKIKCHIVCDEMLFEHPEKYEEGCTCECHDADNIYEFSREDRQGPWYKRKGRV